MSPLDFVTVKYPIPNINHEDEHYQTKDMMIWGAYLVDASGQLFRKDYPAEYVPDYYTGQFEMVGDDPGYCTLEFKNGKLTSWVFDGRVVVYVLTCTQTNFGEPDEFDVVGAFTSLDLAKAQVQTGEWVEVDTTAHALSNHCKYKVWTITPKSLIESGIVSDNPPSDGQ